MVSAMMANWLELPLIEPFGELQLLIWIVDDPVELHVPAADDEVLFGRNRGRILGHDNAGECTCCWRTYIDIGTGLADESGIGVSGQQNGHAITDQAAMRPNIQFAVPEDMETGQQITVPTLLTLPGVLAVVLNQCAAFS